MPESTARPATLRLNDGINIPQMGLGVMYVPIEELPPLIADAAKCGYRHIDTATHYHNEVGVGEALRRADIDRDEMFVTTKLPNSHHGYDEAMRAFDASEKAIGRIDLYLVHWPQPPKGKYRDCWRALVKLRDEGRVKSIGVSNFLPQLIDEIVGDTGVTPAVNQIELHPGYQQEALRNYNRRHGILTESWSPLEQGRALKHPVVQAIAQRQGLGPAQIILQWHLQKGLVVIPKAADRKHLKDNFAAFECILSESDISAIDSLDRPDGNFGPDPMFLCT